MIKEGVSYVLGFDISTKTIGVTLMDMSGKLIDLTYISMPKSSKKNGNITIYDKVDFTNEFIQKYKDVNIKHIFIEEPLKNGPNINTTILLAKFNGMISQKLYELFDIYPEHLTVYECRCIFFPEYIVIKKVKNEMKKTISFPSGKDKKQLVFDKVSWLEPQHIWKRNKFFLPIDEVFDMTDSYVVARAGLTKYNYVGDIIGYDVK